MASFDDGPLLSPQGLLVHGNSIRAGRGAKLALYTLLLFTVPSVLMLYALLSFEFGERRPQLTARTGYTPMKGSYRRRTSSLAWAARLRSFSYQAAHI